MISVEQAACNALAAYLRTALTAVTGLTVFSEWPEPDVVLTMPRITIVPIGSRGSLDCTFDGRSIDDETVSATTVTGTYEMDHIEQSVQIDIWARSDGARENLIGRLDEALSAGIATTAPTLLGLHDPTRDGTLVVLGDDYVGTADFMFGSPSRLREAQGEREFRAMYRGQLRCVRSQRVTTAKILEASLVPTAPDGFELVDTYAVVNPMAQHTWRAWYRELRTLSDANVSQWTDKGAGARHATGVTPTWPRVGQPFGNKRTIDFAGGSGTGALYLDAGVASSLVSTTSFYSLIAFRADHVRDARPDIYDDAFLWGDSDGYMGLALNVVSNVTKATLFNWRVGATEYDLATVDIKTGEWTVLEAILTGNKLSLRKNNETPYVVDSGTTELLGGNMRIGRHGGGLYGFDGQMGELAFSQSLPSAPLRARMRRFAMRRFGISP